MTYLFVAHDLAVERHVSDRIAVTYLGAIVEVASAATLHESPAHPYTIALVSAIRDPEVERRRRAILLEGNSPSPVRPPAGCRFHARCPYVQQTRCRDEVPRLRRLGDGQAVACHWAEAIMAGEIEPSESVSPGEPDPVAA